MKKIAIIVFILLTSGILSFILYNTIVHKTPKKVLSTTTVKPTKSVVTSFPTPTASPSATPFLTLSKKSYIVALFGDSMIDTLGDNLEVLSTSLKAKYPTTQFVLYNYGIGAQNVAGGLSRLDSSFANRERNYPPITQIKADVIIIGTFSYNPFFPHDPGRHRQLLKELLERLRGTGASLYLLAEQGPREVGFGKGETGPNMVEEEAHKHALRIIEQLDNSVAVANELGIPIINVYAQSKVSGKFGNPVYVNFGDGIHYSDSGRVFTASSITSAVRFP